MKKKETFTIVVSGLMTETEARIIANVAGAVKLTNDVDVIIGELKHGISDTQKVLDSESIECDWF